MGSSLIEMLPWIYASIQGTITIIISILGAKYVRNEFLIQKNRANQQELQINIQQQQENQTNSNNDKQNVTKTDDVDLTDNNDIQQSQYRKMSKMSFCKLWFQIVWKMRSVYCAFAVHLFDVLTDVLVLIEWWYLETNGVDVAHIDAKIMAIAGIAVLLFQKVVSALVFWAKERNIMRCILQLLDLLIFQEIYVSHKKIVTQFRNQSKSNDSDETEAVETTTSFKYIRNLEAVFESIPQSILQLVFIMRTSGKFEGEKGFLIISIISIIQSIISMSNSILKNDNIFMSTPKWKKHKKRVPPTSPFLKHALCRLSEVIYRIGLFALFWTVCEGKAFSILLGTELFLLFPLTILDIHSQQKHFRIWEEVGIDDLCLRIQSLIIMPSELVYALNGSDEALTSAKFEYYDSHEFGGNCIGCCCCCYPLAVWISTLCFLRRDHYVHVSLKIGSSIMEWLIVILWALFFEDRFWFLFSVNHGLYVFIVSMICYLIYTQYLYLFPNFALPFGVSVRSRFGYAFNGELEELQRVKIPKFPAKFIRKDGRRGTKFEVNNEDAFWNMGVEHIYRYGEERKHATCAMFALSNEQYHVVEWLENEKNANKHIELFNEWIEAKKHLEIFNEWLKNDNKETFNRWLKGQKGIIGIKQIFTPLLMDDTTYTDWDATWFKAGAGIHYLTRPKLEKIFIAWNNDENGAEKHKMIFKEWLENDKQSEKRDHIFGREHIDIASHSYFN